MPSLSSRRCQCNAVTKVEESVEVGFVVFHTRHHSTSVNDSRVRVNPQLPKCEYQSLALYHRSCNPSDACVGAGTVSFNVD
ncbi:hypothetical protein QCA50_010427 [Cerrena zonata]|uniref:Uncharacterized protein n=1 Tax=Cerrena zonata TaxID=2478898 RepID=A0AAW0G3W5_9APHY